MEVFLSSPWIPPEWIASHGHTPRLLACDPAARAHNAYPTAGVCSFAATALEFAQSVAGSASIFCSTCDQLRRAGDNLKAESHSHTFLFNFPATWKSESALELLRSELLRLSAFLVRIGGCPPSSAGLESSFERYASRRARLSEAAAILRGTAYANAVARFLSGDWEDLLPLAVTPDDPGSANPRPVRLALIGGPLGPRDWPLLSAIESLGAQVVLNGTETGERAINPGQGWPQTAFESRPFCVDHLAFDLLSRCVDVFQRPNTRLYKWLAERLFSRQVSGIVLWHHVGCDLWRAEAASLREAFGLPLLVIEADQTGSVSPRNLGRIQAFLESLHQPLSTHVR